MPLVSFNIVIITKEKQNINSQLSLGVRVCSDGSAPTCADGSAPVRDMNRGTAPCPGQGRGRAGKPATCPDGQPPARQRRGGGQGRQRGSRGQGGQNRQGGRGNRGRAGGNKKCSKSERVCCDGSTPNFARWDSRQSFKSDLISPFQGWKENTPVQ